MRRPLLLAALACCCALALRAPRAGAAASPSPCTNEALRTGASAALPDCRVYEQVSPGEKGGANAVPSNFSLPAQAAPDGEALAYLGYAPFPGSAGSTPLYAAHLSTRGSHGWSTSELTPPKTSSAPAGDYTVEYAFSEDLHASVVAAPLQELAPNAPAGVYNLFLRDAAGGYSLLDTLPPLVPPPAGCPSCYLFTDASAFAGASSGFGVVVFESSAQYEAGMPAVPSLYESALEGGQRVVRLVGYLPNGEPASARSTAGGGSAFVVGAYAGDGRLANAVSANGSRVVFQAAANGGEPYEAAQKGMIEVYDRLEHARTLELSAPAPGAAPADPAARPARYWTASAGGARVFFTSSAELTSASNTGGGRGEALYEYDLEEPGSPLHDLSLDPREAAGARVLGVLGASEGGEYVYFAAEGALAPGAVAGSPNLYLVHDRQAPVLVATLSASDGRDWTATPSAEGQQLASYVAPDGRHLAFTSLASLPTANFGSGHERRSVTGKPPSQVYEYTAPGGAAGTLGTLDCASCGVSEGAPSGDALLGGAAQSASANEGSSGTPFHQPRALSANGGRVFFTALDAAGARGVFEYERAGEGSCAQAGGCDFALAAPPKGGEDIFLDASATGADVFFATASALAPSDGDALVDVYDASAGGGFAAESQTRCEAACRPAGSSAIEAPAILSGAAGPSGNLRPRARAPRGAAAKRHARPRRKRRHARRRHGSRCHGSRCHGGRRHGGRRHGARRGPPQRRRRGRARRRARGRQGRPERAGPRMRRGRPGSSRARGAR
ncbi:MAG: hypothetical protein ACYCUM_01860 [Solirubrobacteraceae bacterium]